MPDMESELSTSTARSCRASPWMLLGAGLLMAATLWGTETERSSTNTVSSGSTVPRFIPPEGVELLTRTNMTAKQRSASELRMSLIRDRIRMERSLTNASPRERLDAVKDWETRNQQAMQQLGSLERQVAVERAETVRAARISGQEPTGRTPTP